MTTTENVKEYPGVGMLATSRCDKCGGQAYVEATLKGGSLLFCAHHGTANWDKLVGLKAKIADHRKFLLKQEGHESKVPAAAH